MGIARQWLRLAVVALHLALGLVLAVGAAVVGGRVWHRRAWGRMLIRTWSRAALAALGVRVHEVGCLDPRAGLLVANHISWLDIPVLHAVAPVRFVAKSEVSSWPLVGILAAAAGTVFLDRRRITALHGAVERTTDLLRRGDRVCVFPEATTGPGGPPRRFAHSLFQAAVDSGVPVQPAALRYIRAGGTDDVVPFVGDDTFLAHLRRLAAQPRTDAVVQFAPVLDAGTDRRTLAAQARSHVAALLASRPELPHAHRADR